MRHLERISKRRARPFLAQSQPRRRRPASFWSLSIAYSTLHFNFCVMHVVWDVSLLGKHLLEGNLMTLLLVLQRWSGLDSHGVSYAPVKSLLNLEFWRHVVGSCIFHTRVGLLWAEEPGTWLIVIAGRWSSQYVIVLDENSLVFGALETRWLPRGHARGTLCQPTPAQNMWSSPGIRLDGQTLPLICNCAARFFHVFKCMLDRKNPLTKETSHSAMLGRLSRWYVGMRQMLFQRISLLWSYLVLLHHLQSLHRMRMSHRLQSTLPSALLIKQNLNCHEGVMDTLVWCVTLAVGQSIEMVWHQLRKDNRRRTHSGHVGWRTSLPFRWDEIDAGRRWFFFQLRRFLCFYVEHLL